MLISKLLAEGIAEYPYRIENEKEFEYLSLATYEHEKPVCTFLDNPKFAGIINSSAAMLLITEDLYPLFKGRDIGLCISEYPRDMFFRLHNFLCEHTEYGYTRPSFDTVIGENCNISPLSSIAQKNVRIGNNVTIEEFCVIRENTVIGDGTIIRSGAKIGGHGFEFKRRNAAVLPVAHAGGVVIGHDAEIQYNTCVDRAVYPWDDTRIGNYTKIDNLVHIGHAVKLADDVLVVANSGIGGRTEIGKGAWIGFGATVINGTTVGKNARVNMGAVATRPVPDGGSVTGNFAIEHKKFIENLKKSLQ